MRIYITSEEFNVLQEWQVPYAGYIKGVGYTYPKFLTSECFIGIENSICTSKDYFVHPIAIQFLDSSVEAKFKSYNFSEDDILNKITIHKDSNMTTYIVGEKFVTVPTNNHRVKVKIDEETCSIKIGVENFLTKKIDLYEVVYSSDDVVVKSNKRFFERITGNVILDAAVSGVDVASDGIKSIMLERGKYLPYNTSILTWKGVKHVRMKKTGDIVIRNKLWNTVVNAKALNYVRIGGKFIGVTGTALSMTKALKDVKEDPNTKTVTSLITKTAIIGLGCIPVYGWAIAIVAGIADGMYGDIFYDYVDDLISE